MLGRDGHRALPHPGHAGADMARDLHDVRVPACSMSGCVRAFVRPVSALRVRLAGADTSVWRTRTCPGCWSSHVRWCPPCDVRPRPPGHPSPGVRLSSVGKPAGDAGGCPVVSALGVCGRPVGEPQTRPDMTVRARLSLSGGMDRCRTGWAVSGQVWAARTQPPDRPRGNDLCRIWGEVARRFSKGRSRSTRGSSAAAVVHGESPRGRLTKSHRLSQEARPELTDAVAHVYARARARVGVPLWISCDFALRHETTRARWSPGVARRGYW